jgi:hypothetical protein
MTEVYVLQPVTRACELSVSGRRSLVGEPNLAELMQDPITLALMAADRVDRCELNMLLSQVRESLR